MHWGDAVSESPETLVERPSEADDIATDGPVFKPFLPQATPKQDKQDKQSAPAVTSEPVVEAEQAPVAKNPPAKDEPACQRFGTAVDFAASPAEAAVRAGKDQKLLFVLHISGNFDDSKFT